jgi:hypothetical protein
MAVSETYLVENSGKTTWFDPARERCASICRRRRRERRRSR